MKQACIEHIEKTLDILNRYTRDSLFFEWELEICRDYSENESASALLISAKFIYNDEEIKISEWAEFLTNINSDSYFNSGGAPELQEAINERRAVVSLTYKAFISQFKIIYNLTRGEL